MTIMLSVLLVGVKKMELNIGLSEILGDHIGEKMAHLNLSEELIIWEFKLIVLGLFQRTLGPMILEIRLN